jgi:hypothetical protein
MTARVHEQRINIIRGAELLATMLRTTVPFRRPGAAAPSDLPQSTG